MQPHPIPQNVTYFQFKLVGDMTLKQFFYLAIGVSIAYVVFLVLAKDYPFVAWPVTVISAGLGAGFAFLPIASRPLDYWLVAFLKAIYSPTKRVWKKAGKNYKEDPLFQSRLVMYMTGLNQINQIKPENQKTGVSDTLAQGQTNALISSGLAVPEPLPTVETLGKTVDLARKAQALQIRIVQTERTLSQIKENTEKPTTIPVDYTQEVNKIMGDLQILMKQASEIRQEMISVSQPHAQQHVIPFPPPAKVQVVILPKTIKTAVALTSFPNVINGIVQDKTGNYLEGIVAVIYDKEGLPVRALKTNKLGQFTGSTPLPNGTYTLELEKDNFTFNVLQLELSGQVLPPLQITAK